jgi:hypothetical protein
VLSKVIAFLRHEPSLLAPVKAQVERREEEGTLRPRVVLGLPSQIGSHLQIPCHPHQEKKGFHIPHRDDETMRYRKVLQDMYRFYSDSNEELYRLMRQLGPGIGWSGKFPGSYEELLEVLKNVDEGKLGSAESPLAGTRKKRP